LEKLGKREIEIDVIAQSSTKVYLISCKARDQFFGPEAIKDFLFPRYDDFQKNLEQDFEMAGEIEDYARCVRQSSTYLESRKFEGKEIVPILMTSDLRPLSLESVRSRIGESRDAPGVRVIQAKRMDEFPFD